MKRRLSSALRPPSSVLRYALSLKQPWAALLVHGRKARESGELGALEGDLAADAA